MAKYRSNPTPWPNGAYYFLRFVQFLCAIGQVGILTYFIYYLVKARLSIPNEFIILYVAVRSFPSNLTPHQKNRKEIHQILQI